MATKKLTPNVVREIHYRCQLDRFETEGTVLGYWTGDIDTWGKLTIRVIETIDTTDEDTSTSHTIYLFHREIISVDEPSESLLSAQEEGR